MLFQFFFFFFEDGQFKLRHFTHFFVVAVQYFFIKGNIINGTHIGVPGHHDLFQAAVFLAGDRKFFIVANDLRVGQCHTKFIKSGFNGIQSVEHIFLFCFRRQ